jgi:hypothetical protein
MNVAWRKTARSLTQAAERFGVAREFRIEDLVPRSTLATAQTTFTPRPDPLPHTVIVPRPWRRYNRDSARVRRTSTRSRS